MRLKTPKAGRAPLGPETEERLLEAAGEVFAERGFRVATVREICRQAGANGAAVNYHFGGKERLYADVLRHAHSSALRRHPPDGGLPPGAKPEARLRAFILSFLHRMLDPGQPAWQARLLSCEMAQPTKAFDDLVDRGIRPSFERLAGIVAELLGPKAPLRKVVACARSIVGQCLFYRFAQPVLRRLSPREKFGPGEIGPLADHVTLFSLRGMRGNRPKGSRPKRLGQNFKLQAPSSR